MIDALPKTMPATGEQYLSVALRGLSLLHHPFLNKGLAFSAEERFQLGLKGLLPSAERSIDIQLTEVLDELERQPTELDKNIFLNSLLDRNETLFYRIIQDHVSEMVPLIYTPVVGEAIANYSHNFNQPRGIYLSYPDRDRMEEILEHRAFKDVDVICVTDGERILGLGDEGAGGIGITVGKLALYTICAGVNPSTCLPIGLDVGTNNESLLNDPEYIGWRHERVRGKDYDDFIAQFVDTVKRKFPKVYLHWEDFGKANATRILQTYRPQLCTFNDDIQGTGAVALATLLAALKTTGQSLKDQRVAFLGGGTAGVGIADKIRLMMMREGLSEEEAYSRFYLVDINGVLQEGQDLADFQKPYAKSPDAFADWHVQDAQNITLAEVVKHAAPSVLFGVSSQTGAFTEAIIRAMADRVERPIVMPLSNPTSKCEAVPQDVINWTEGRAVVATGSPFGDAVYQGKTIPVTQCNNAFIFPGIGLGVVATKPSVVSDDMIFAAVECLASHAPSLEDPAAPLLPLLEDAREVCQAIALAVGAQAYDEGVATVGTKDDLESLVRGKVWQADYLPYRPD
ncbi:NAD-dependent malic enzyme [Cerasicoccus maritimus]|uniref:NAD-dependent malic enzyme n=1 Tax=Cerasicoccus maritimus TaxID=490089 RepID=UPI002852C84E|nr:NAD-dependent malic enzyme [Cerasicoccus maritimus]